MHTIISCGCSWNCTKRSNNSKHVYRNTSVVETGIKMIERLTCTVYGVCKKSESMLVGENEAGANRDET